jgi:Holliday junction resolvase
MKKEKTIRNNRSAGHSFERQIVNELKDLGFSDVVTSRAESRNMDNNGVDIFGKTFKYFIQCKNSKSIVKYYDLIGKFEKLKETVKSLDKPLIIFHRKTYKANTRFVTEGDFVLMRKKDFYNLLKNGKDI